jgi:hypothetical protein
MCLRGRARQVGSTAHAYDAQHTYQVTSVQKHPQQRKNSPYSSSNRIFPISLISPYPLINFAVVLKKGLLCESNFLPHSLPFPSRCRRGWRGESMAGTCVFGLHFPNSSRVCVYTYSLVASHACRVGGLGLAALAVRGRCLLGTHRRRRQKVIALSFLRGRREELGMDC